MVLLLCCEKSYGVGMVSKWAVSLMLCGCDIDEFQGSRVCELHFGCCMFAHPLFHTASSSSSSFLLSISESDSSRFSASTAIALMPLILQLLISSELGSWYVSSLRVFICLLLALACLWSHEVVPIVIICWGWTSYIKLCSNRVIQLWYCFF